MQILGYELDELLGQGGMGAVWSARHIASDTPVAIKVIRTDITDKPEFSSSLDREVQAMARLEHPSIVEILAYEATDFGQPFLVMEKADATLMQLNRTPSWTHLRRILLDILDGLAYAHARGVIHRDIKPPNILLFDTEEGWTAQLGDFGIAQAVIPGFSRKDSAERSVISAGTLQYMPPEQLRGHWRDYGPWTDLYALACMTWQIVCGEGPFTADTPMALTYQHLAKLPPQFEPRIAVPEGLEGWLRRALAKAPSTRFQSAAEASFALLALAPVRDEEPEIFELAGAPTEFFSELAGTIVEKTADAPVELDYLKEPLHDPAMAPIPVVPLPATWKRPPYRSLRIEESLGLFALRETPVHGLDEERDLLWSALDEVFDSKLRAPIIKGNAAADLMNWFGERAHEVSGATTIRVSHGQSSPDVLAALAEELLAVWSMAEDDLEETIRRRLSAGRVIQDLDDRVATLVELISLDNDRISSNQKKVVLAQTLRDLAHERPHVILVENVHYATDLLDLVQYMVEEMPDARLCFVLQERDDVEAHSEWQARRELLLENEAAFEIDASLDMQSRLETIDAMLPLTRESRSLVFSGSRDAFEARQLVAHWIENDRVDHDGGEFIFEVDDVPSREELFELRLEDARSGVDDDALQSWVVASVLGDSPRWDEWRLACAARGLLADETWLDALIARSLVRRRITGFTFGCNEMREALLTFARQEYDRAALNGECADTLMRLYPNPTIAMTMRIASHLDEAERRDEAIPLLFDTALTHNSRGDERDVAALLARRLELMDAEGLPFDARERVQQVWLRVDNVIRDADQLDEAIEIARRKGYDNELAYCLRVKGRFLRGVEESSAAQTLLEESDAVFEDLGNTHGLFVNRLTMTYRAIEQGDLEWARREAQRAQELATNTPSLRWRRASAIGVLITIELEDGNYDEVRRLGEEGLEIAREDQNRLAEGAIHVSLGEVARIEGRYEDALRSFRESRRLDVIQGTKAHNVSDINIASVLLALGENDEAIELFSSLHEDRQPWMAAYTTSGLMSAYASKGELDESRKWLAEFSAIESTHFDDHQLWLLKLGLERAEELGETELAREIQHQIESQNDIHPVVPLH